MEEAAELGNYLPLSVKIPKEQEYIAFLWDAFETKSFVYFNIWQFKQTRPADFEKGLIGDI